LRKKKNIKPLWEKEMEDYINGMSEEEWKQFLIDTDFEYYNSEHFRKMKVIYPQWLQDLVDNANEGRNK
jgi:hypothetical protein